MTPALQKFAPQKIVPQSLTMEWLWDYILSLCVYGIITFVNTVVVITPPRPLSSLLYFSLSFPIFCRPSCYKCFLFSSGYTRCFLKVICVFFSRITLKKVHLLFPPSFYRHSHYQKASRAVRHWASEKPKKLCIRETDIRCIMYYALHLIISVKGQMIQRPSGYKLLVLSVPWYGC